MWQPANEYQFAEVFVFSQQDALILKGQGHQALVAGLRIDGDSRKHVVSLSDKKCL